MPNITSEPIGINRYAPATACAVNLYGLDSTEGMTLGQLVVAVCIRRAASLEHASVRKSNELVQTTGKLKALSLLTEKLMSDNVTSMDTLIDLSGTGYTPSNVGMNPSIYDFLTLELGVTVSSRDISNYSKKMAAYDSIKQMLEQCSNLSQRQAIDLQSFVSRRDVAYNTSSSILRTMQANNNHIAGKF